MATSDFLALDQVRAAPARRHPEYRARAALASFISLWARRWYNDHPMSRTLDRVPWPKA